MFKVCSCNTKKSSQASTVAHVTYHVLGNTRFSIVLIQKNAHKTLVSKKDKLQKVSPFLINTHIGKSLKDLHQNINSGYTRMGDYVWLTSFACLLL